MKDIKNKWPFLSESSDKVNVFVRNISGNIETYFTDYSWIPIFINKNSTCWVSSFDSFDRLIKSGLKRLKLSINPRIAIKIKFILMLKFLPGKFADIDHCVFFNHNIMSTTLWPDIQDIDSIIRQLVCQHPDYPIIFRSLNFIHNDKLLKDLTKNQCRLMRVREVALFDPGKKLTKSQRRHLREDKKLLESGGYQIAKVETLNKEEVKRIYDLYTKIYIEKYSKLNPQYTEYFFSSILTDPKYGIFLLKKDNKIDAFALFEREGNIIQCPCLGHDTSLPTELGLYRQIGAVLDNYCIKNNLLSNESSGVYKFKQRRGCQLTSEYYAIYYKNLSLIKRIFWTVYIYISNRMPKVS